MIYSAWGFYFILSFIEEWKTFTAAENLIFDVTLGKKRKVHFGVITSLTINQGSFLKEKWSEMDYRDD